MICLLVILSLFVHSVTYGQPSPSYKIVGHIKDMPDQEIYLDYYEKGFKYRHTVVSEKGYFLFTGSVSEPVFANIHHRNGHGEIELFLDNSLWKKLEGDLQFV